MYIMIPLVILVWGVVFSQLYAYIFSEPMLAKQEVEQEVNIDEIKEDTFSIVAAYRDPFLGKKLKSYRKNNNTQPSSNSTNRSNNKKKVNAPEKPWPSIAYQGMIKNNNSERKVGIVKVNGKEHLVRFGDVIDEITFLSIEKQIIKVRFQKEVKTITK